MSATNALLSVTLAAVEHAHILSDKVYTDWSVVRWQNASLNLPMLMSLPSSLILVQWRRAPYASCKFPL